MTSCYKYLVPQKYIQKPTIEPPKSFKNRRWRGARGPAKHGPRKKLLRKRKFWAGPAMREQKRSPKGGQKSSKTNKNQNVSCTLSEEAPGMLFGTENVIKNLFRSKHIASLNEMYFCIMSCLLFLPKTDLKHSRAQYKKSMFVLLFTVVLSTSLSGNENQHLSLVAFKPHSF